MRILVADDDAVMATLLSELLQDWGHSVTVVHDGASAWQELEGGEFRMMISDWYMPGLDGPELCSRLRASDSTHYVYVILVTSQTGDDELVEGLASGADDFVRKTPFNAREFQARVRAGERIVELELELARRNSELEGAIDVMRKDLVAAAAVQKRLLPSDATVAGAVQFASLFCPSALVSGDIFNVLPLDDDRCAFYVVDVAGHGVSASLTAVSLSSILTRDFLTGFEHADDGLARSVDGVPSVDAVVATLNERFQTGHELSSYFTMIYGVYDAEAGSVRLCQAGHPLPIVVPARGGARVVGCGGFPVGLLPQATYTAAELTVEPGDRLYLYSDGVTECMNASHEPFGDQRLIEYLDAQRHRPIADILAGLEKLISDWTGSSVLNDDVSMLALDVLPPRGR
jgi:sigma-B regulation protein RsbU (phosphoserine phosphatase)